MITADTITDRQIRDLRASLDREYLRSGSVVARDGARTCSRALGSDPMSLSGMDARARCAEILNARNAKPEVV